MEYEVVNNPNYQPQQEQYTPDGQQYVPNGQPQGQQGGFQQQPQQPQYNTGAMPQPQQQYQAPQTQQPQYQQPQNQTNYTNGGGQQKQVLKRASQSGQPIQCGNLVVLEGYMNNMSYKTLPSGSNRLGFTMVIETPVFQGGQQQFNPQTGQPVLRDFSYRCQAWGNVADTLSQWPEGTPVKVTGSLNRWSTQNPDTGQTIWYTDVKVSRFDIM